MSETRAVLRGVRLSVDKGRLVAQPDPRQEGDQALNILTFTQKKLLASSRRFWNRQSPMQNTTMALTSTN